MRSLDAAAPAAIVGAAGALSFTVVTIAVTWCRVLRAERAALVCNPERVGGTTGPAALVVFGSEAFADRPGLELQSRLDHARRLWRDGVAAPIFVSGGLDGAVDEVEVMARYLTDRGVPPDQVRPARPGDNTRATVEALASIRASGQADSFVAVSTAFHAHRIRTVCKRRGIPVVVSARADSPEMRPGRLHRARIATEIVACIAYALPRSWTAWVSTEPGTWRHTLPHVLGGRLPVRRLLSHGPHREVE
jgi:vancomycin permeability regulator SanA